MSDPRDPTNRAGASGLSAKHSPAPSWIDRLIDAVDRLPASGWYVYPFVLAVEVVILQAITWLDGSVAWGRFMPIEVLIAFWTVLPIAVVHYLDRSARRMLLQLRPSLTLDENGFDTITTQFTTMPSRPVLVAHAVGVVSFWLLLLASPFLLDRARSSALHTIAAFFLVSVNFALLGALIYHTVRQLWLVTQLYDLVEAIDLSQLAPLYAPSVLTARTAVVWILALYLSVALFSDLLSSRLAVAVVVGMGLAAALTFLVPLLQVHHRIAEAKERDLSELDLRIDQTIGELKRRSDTLDLHEMDGLNKLVLGLIAGRDHIDKVPTWPWSPGTPTAVLSALILPVVLWLIQTLLERLIR